MVQQYTIVYTAVPGHHQGPPTRRPPDITSTTRSESSDKTHQQRQLSPCPRAQPWPGPAPSTAWRAPPQEKALDGRTDWSLKLLLVLDLTWDINFPTIKYSYSPDIHDSSSQRSQFGLIFLTITTTLLGWVRLSKAVTEWARSSSRSSFSW